MGAQARYEDVPPPSPSRVTPVRRDVCRHPIAVSDARVGWWDGETFRSTAAEVVDLSHRGAKLTVRTFPPVARALWFHPPGVPTREGWFEAETVSRTRNLFGPRTIGVLFREILPDEVVKAVVYGPDIVNPFDAPVWLPDDPADRPWW